MKTLLPIVLFICALAQMAAQTDSTKTPKFGKIEAGGLLDVYYGYNFNQPKNKDVPYFVTAARQNELNINLAALDLKYTHDRLRGRVLIGFGSYMNANYASEPLTLKNLVEANFGFRPFGKKNIWIEAGVFISPYTNEGPISKDHLMYSRSLSPEYVPYYLSAIKLTVPLHPKVNAYFYLTNGWQVIADNNRHKSLGTHLEYKINDKNTFNWTTYIGDERSAAAPTNRMRYFSDFYWVHNPDGKFSATACLDFGLQRRVDTLASRQTSHFWASGNFIARYRFSDIVSLSGRAEFFYDPDRVQITSITPITVGFQTFGAGLCLNINLFKNAMFRLEGRGFYSTQNVFFDNKNQVRPYSAWLMGNFSFWF